MQQDFRMIAARTAWKGNALFAGIETLLVVFLVFFFYVRHLNTLEFHIDEGHWIATSYMFESYFKGEFWSDAWKESHETVTNPPVPRYFIGLGRSIGGYHQRDINRIWQYDQDMDFNIRAGAMPSDGLLWWSRLPMAILAVMSIWMAFWIVKKVAGPVAGYFWILWATASAFLLEHTRRAMAESPVLFFVIVASIFTYLATERLKREDQHTDRKIWLYLGIVGISIGLAGASKLNGLSVLGVPLLCIGATLWKRKDSIKSRFTQFTINGVLVTALTAVAFLGSYPYLWPDLLGRTIHLFRNRMEEMRIQTVVFPSSHIDNWNKRLALLPRRILQDHASFHFRRAIYVNFGLVMLGTAVICFAILDWAKGRDRDSAPLVFLTTAAAASFPTFFTLLDWDRYFLFPVFFSSMISAIALGWLVQQLFAITPKYKSSFSPSAEPGS